MNKGNKLVLKRHYIFYKIVCPLFLAIQKKKYNIDVEEFHKKYGDQYLILMNHQTEGDQFFINMAFKGQIYFVASEDIFTNGIASKLLSYFLGPIPIKKNMTDLRAVKQCMRVIKEGGSIALAPEGNRTYSGSTGYMNPAISKLCKSLNVPVCLFRIEGGYGKYPRWADKVRSGNMHAKVVKVITSEECKSMTDEELLNEIHKYLDINECTDINSEFYSENSAEYVERFLYTCPKCGFTTIKSDGQLITCTKCGKTAKYLKNKTLEGIDNKFEFSTLKEWYDYQENFVLKNDIEKNKPIFEDKVKYISVIPYRKKIVIDKNALSKLYEDKIEINSNGKTFEMLFSDIITISCVNKNKLNIYYKDDVYQLKGDKRFNPLKYMNFYYKKMHELKGEIHDKFLGL